MIKIKHSSFSMLKISKCVVFEKIMFKYVIIKKTDKKRRIFYIKTKKITLFYIVCFKTW